MWVLNLVGNVSLVNPHVTLRKSFFFFFWKLVIIGCVFLIWSVQYIPSFFLIINSSDPIWPDCDEFATAATSQASALGYVVKYGNDDIGWPKICHYVNNFCNKTIIAIVISIIGYLFFLSLLIQSTFTRDDIKNIPWNKKDETTTENENKFNRNIDGSEEDEENSLFLGVARSKAN